MKPPNQAVRIFIVIIGLFAGYAAVSMMREWGREESKTKAVLNQMALVLKMETP